VKDDSSVEVSATCFAISRTQVITAHHNIADFDEAGSVKRTYENCVIGNSVKKARELIVFNLPLISLSLVAFDVDQDWAVLKRTDGGEFGSFLEVCEEINLPNPSVQTVSVKVIHFPIVFLLESEVVYLEAHNVDSRVQQYGDPEHKTLIVDSGLFRGSSGAPYIDARGKVVAMHLNSASGHAEYKQNPRKIRRIVAVEFDALSDALSNQSDSKYASLKQGLVLRKVNAIMQLIATA
jgi:S1-C subfamily serine protease